MRHLKHMFKLMDKGKTQFYEMCSFFRLTGHNAQVHIITVLDLGLISIASLGPRASTKVRKKDK